MVKRYPFAVIKEQLAAKGEKALDFALGRRRIALPAAIDSWVRAHPELALQPSARADMDAFCEAAADYMAREYGVALQPGQILPTAGGRVAMTAFIACVLRANDTVIVTEPGYPAFARLAAHRHASVISVALDPGNAFAPQLSDLSERQATMLRVISVNYPNNPTGAKLSHPVVACLLELAGADTVLFNDATYGPLVYDESPGSMLGSDALQRQDLAVVELHSFSKLFPLGPIALSFLAGTRETMAAMNDYSEYAWSPLSRLQIQATVQCLSDAGRFGQLRNFFPSQLGALRKTLTEIGLQPYPAPAGIYTLCRVPEQIGGQPVHSAEEAAGVLIDRFDLAVVPLDTQQHSYLRFSSLYQPQELERLADLRVRLRLS